MAFVYLCCFLFFFNLFQKDFPKFEGRNKEDLGLKEVNYEMYFDHMMITGSSCSRFTCNSFPSKKLKFSNFWKEIEQQDEPNLDRDGILYLLDPSQGNQDSSGEKPQDADYYSNGYSISYELEALIMARFPRLEYWKLFFLDKRCVDLLKIGDLFKIRREIGFTEPSIFMSPSSGNAWWTSDRDFKSCRKLPDLASEDICFISGDKESLFAGTHLLVAGREIEGCVVYRYELARNQWEKGPLMIIPRCLFASASQGNSAFVAGGLEFFGGTSSDSAEKYDPDCKKWTPLPRMNKKRKFCSGCFMDNRFYVIGGRNEDGGLTYTLTDDPVQNCHAPPLIAVVNSELYSLEATSNQLKVYLKKTNSWKPLGDVPVKANTRKGWGVAFKSLGNELLIIGSSPNAMDIYTCCPDPDASELHWRNVDSGKTQHCHFLLNCCVMMA
ncbi:oxidase [Lithospermum erythrorhizon]|uniref:Oxidase n=1 Tax=Lithospermum erythrorhizon TaxID=34254 RepID=A0AAV3PIR5_LITER